VKHSRLAQQMTAIGGSAIMLAAIVGPAPAAASTNSAPPVSQAVEASPQSSDRVVNVTRPFQVSAATRDGRLTVVSESDRSVRVYSAKPRTVTFQLVKTGREGQRQFHKFKVRLKKGVNFVRDLEAGRTYKVKYGKKAYLRVTPMQKVADVRAAKATFTTKQTEARLSVDHIADWARGGTQNTMYRWKITSYGDSTLRNGFLAAGGASEDPTMMVDLPTEGMFRIDIAAMNPLGSTSMTLFSQETVEKAWKKRGRNGNIRLAALPAVADSELEDSGLGLADVDDPNDVALDNANAAANSAEYAAIDASRAAGRAREASSPEEASREAAKARQSATRADEFASLANDWKDQIPGPNENRLDAEAAVDRANSAADRAEFSANDGTWFAVDHWRNEAIRAMALAAQHAEAAAARTSETADEDATDAATRARYAATQAAREASGISDASPDRIEQAQQAVIEADHAADQAEAAAAMARVAEQYRQAEVIATMPDEAAAASTQATHNAQEAREVSDQEQADPYDSAAASYADRAEAYADAAAVAAADVAYRYQAQQEAASGQQNLQDSALSLIRARTSADSATAMGHAQASNTYAGAAETDATESAQQAALVTDTSDERPAADQAASEAAVSAELARANSDDAMRHITDMTVGEAKTQHDLADQMDSSTDAAIHAASADTLAGRAWEAVAIVDDGNTEDLTAATERANVTQAYADLANIYVEETRQRELAQTANEQSADQLQRAAGTATAEEAYVFLLEARNQATAAEDARDAIADSITDREAAFGPDARVNDQLARAEAAAQQARANALAAEQYALPTQELLNEQLVFDAASLTVTPGGDTQITFAKNPNDTRAALRYSAHANGIPGALTDNRDGTIAITWQGLPVAAGGYTFTVVPAGINDERVSTSPTAHTPAAPSAAELSSVLTMREASVIEVCGETPGAPGTMENGECVGTKPLSYDTAALEYATTPYTYRTESRQEYGHYDWTYSWGHCTGSGKSGNWSNGDPYCQQPVVGWHTVTVTVKNDPPAGYSDNGSVYVANDPNPQASRPARVDAAFTDKTWTINGGKYVAVSPLPASDFNDSVPYVYESGKGTYVTRNAPAISKTFAPTFTSLPNGVIAWTSTSSTGQTGTYTELDGDDTGRFTPTITVHTIGGDVIVPAPSVNGVAADQ